MNELDPLSMASRQLVNKKRPTKGNQISFMDHAYAQLSVVQVPIDTCELHHYMVQMSCTGPLVHDHEN